MQIFKSDRGEGGGSTLATDLATENAAQPSETTTPEAEGAQGNTSEAPTLPGWTTSTTKTLRADPRFAGWAAKHNTLDEAILHSISLEEKVRGMVAIPGEDASDEERGTFYKAQGVPDSPEGYTIDPGKGLEVDKKQLEEYKALAHKLHLNQSQAQEFFTMAAERALGEIQAFKKAQDEAKEETTAVLKKEWGADYEKERSVIARGLASFQHRSQLLKDAEATGMGNKASFIRLLHALGKTQLEDSALARPGTAGAKKRASEVLYSHE